MRFSYKIVVVEILIIRQVLYPLEHFYFDML